MQPKVEHLISTISS